MKVSERIIAKKIKGEMVLLNMENGDYFSLNLLGTEIYECVSSGMQTEEIISFLYISTEKYAIFQSKSTPLYLKK